MEYYIISTDLINLKINVYFFFFTIYINMFNNLTRLKNLTSTVYNNINGMVWFSSTWTPHYGIIFFLVHGLTVVAYFVIMVSTIFIVFF